nr:family 43 glycosylhydrolase [Haliscomenobacter sp.]
MLCLVQGIVFSQASIHNPNLSDDRYRNPVIHADYSDPDVVRVGADYYMTASSFSHFPRPSHPAFHRPGQLENHRPCRFNLSRHLLSLTPARQCHLGTQYPAPQWHLLHLLRRPR